MKLFRMYFSLIKNIARIAAICSLILIVFYERSKVTMEVVSWINSAFVSMKENYLIILTLTITPFFLRYLYRFEIKVGKELRSERLHTEIERYIKTPYIAPLHLLYMMKPPRWIKDDFEYPFRDYLYKEATSAFNQIVYMDFIVERIEPSGKRVNLINIIPKNVYIKIIKSLIFVILSIFLYIMYPLFNITEKNYLILIFPFALRHCLILFYIAKAIVKYGRYSYIEKELKNIFGEVNPKVKWIDLYPNTAKGHHILDVWKKECTLRQYRDTEHRSSQKSANLAYPTSYDEKLMVHHELDDSPICPFPSDKLPNNFQYYIIYVNERIINEDEKKLINLVSAYKGKVIDINTVRRLRK